jgi:hypothetical protein
MPSAEPTGTARVDTYGLTRDHMVGRTVNRSLKIYIGISLSDVRDGCEVVEDTLTGIDYACEFGSIGRASGTAVHELREVAWGQKCPSENRMLIVTYPESATEYPKSPVVLRDKLRRCKTV